MQVHRLVYCIIMRESYRTCPRCDNIDINDLVSELKRQAPSDMPELGPAKDPKRALAACMPFLIMPVLPVPSAGPRPTAPKPSPDPWEKPRRATATQPTVTFFVDSTTRKIIQFQQDASLSHICRGEDNIVYSIQTSKQLIRIDTRTCDVKSFFTQHAIRSLAFVSGLVVYAGDQGLYSVVWATKTEKQVSQLHAGRNVCGLPGKPHQVVATVKEGGMLQVISVQDPRTVIASYPYDGQATPPELAANDAYLCVSICVGEHRKWEIQVLSHRLVLVSRVNGVYLRAPRVALTATQLVAAHPNHSGVRLLDPKSGDRVRDADVQGIDTKELRAMVAMPGGRFVATARGARIVCFTF